MGKCKLLGGTAMGKYVWRKSEIVQPEISVTNPTLTVSRDYASSSTDYNYKYTFTCNNIDFSAFKNLASIFAFLDGFSGTPYSQLYTLVFTSAYTRLDYMYNNTGTLYNLIYSSTPYTAEGSTFIAYSDDSFAGSNFFQMSFAGAKKVSDKVLNPIGFVTAMSSDTFPNDGEKGGHWYELIAQMESTNALSLSNLSADTMRDISVEEIQKGVTDGIL